MSPQSHAPDLHGHAVSPSSRLLYLMRLERRDLIAVVIYGAAVAVLALATPVAVNTLVSTVAFQNLLQPLVVLSLLLGVALIAGSVLRTMQYVVVEYLQRRLFVRLVGDLAWRLPRLSAEEQRRRDTSKFVNRFFDVVTAQKTLPTLLIDGTTLALELIIGLAILALYHPLLLALAVLLLAGIVFIIAGLGRGAVRTSVAESYAKHDVAGWLEELVKHPTLFRLPFAQALGERRADEMTHRYLDARRAHFRVVLRQAIGAFALQAATAVVLLTAGGALVIAGTLTLGQLVAAELIVGAVTAGLLKLHKQLEALYDLLASVDKIGALIDLGVDDDSDRDRISLPHNTPEVAVTTGAPPAQRRALILEGVRLGERTSPTSALNAASNAASNTAPLSATLVPGSATGVVIDDRDRATLVDVLTGCVPPVAGRLRFGDDDLGLLRDGDRRSAIAVVRATEILDGTLGENIRVGRQIDAADVVRALQLVELDDVFLGTDGDGLDTPLLPATIAPLGSIGPRLMLARAVAGAPQVLVLDAILESCPPAQATRILQKLRERGVAVVVLSSHASLPFTVDTTLTISRPASSSDVVGGAP